MNKFKNLLETLAYVTGVPILGMIASYVVGEKYNEAFLDVVSKEFNSTPAQLIEKGLSLSSYCERFDALKDVCSFQNEIELLFNSSVVVGVLGLGLIFLVYLAKSVAGKNRKILSIIFNPITVASTFLLSFSLLVQSGIFVYAIYLLEATYLQRVHFIALGLVGLGSVLGAIGLFSAAISLTKNSPMFILGKKIDQESAPGLLKLVSEIALKIGAEKPNNIVLGLEPNFYVTASKVQVSEGDEVLSGTTMYVSMPYLSILSKEELSAVIGHELGHFKGEDTAYSLKFYPAYVRLNKAINQVEDIGVMSLPILATLGLIHSEFSGAEKAIGRIRELEADKVGASLNGSMPLITALLKFGYISKEWNALRKYNIDKLNSGVVYSDLSAIIEELSKIQFAELEYQTAYQELLGSQTSHPRDTHPSIKQRMSSLGVSESAITKEMLMPSETDYFQYLANPNEISEVLSFAEHRLVINLGLAVIPESNKDD